jgi:hypothetical protein
MRQLQRQSSGFPYARQLHLSDIRRSQNPAENGHDLTHRSKRRLFGLKHLAPLRAEAALPRRVLRRRAHMAGPGSGADDADPPDTPPPVLEPLGFTPLERKEFEFSDLDDWMREADQLIRRSQAVLDRLAQERRTPLRSDAA